MSDELEKSVPGRKYVIAVAVFASVTVAAYALRFRWPAYSLGDPGAWASFGDYFSGLVNPIIGIVTVVLVIETLRITRLEANNTRQEMTAQTRLFAAQLERYDREATLSELHKRLEGALTSWNAAVTRQHPRLLRLLLGYIIDAPSDLNSVFSSPSIEQELADQMETPIWHSRSEMWDAMMDEPANLLREFASYCADYDAVAGNSVLTDFYRRRVNKALRAMKIVGYVQPEVFEELSVGRLIFT